MRGFPPPSTTRGDHIVNTLQKRRCYAIAGDGAYFVQILGLASLLGGLAPVAPPSYEHEGRDAILLTRFQVVHLKNLGEMPADRDTKA